MAQKRTNNAANKKCKISIRNHSYFSSYLKKNSKQAIDIFYETDFNLEFAFCDENSNAPVINSVELWAIEWIHLPRNTTYSRLCIIKWTYSTNSAWVWYFPLEFISNNDKYYILISFNAVSHQISDISCLTSELTEDHSCFERIFVYLYFQEQTWLIHSYGGNILFHL